MSSSEIYFKRRVFVQGALWLGSAGVLSACGFKLRGQVTYTFQSVYINGSDVPGLTQDLKVLLKNISGLTVAEHPKDAQVTLELKQKLDDKSVLSLSSGGRAREYSLTKVFSFQLHDKDGDDWMLPGDIEIQRTYLYDDSERLAREIQEQRILQEMQQDAAQQILRRLQKAQRPA